MLDFKIAQKHLSEMVTLMANARTSSMSEVMDITNLTTVGRFVVTGRDFACAVEADSPGSAQIPLELLPKIQKTAASFSDDPIRIRIDGGKIRITSVTISHAEVASTESRVRPIDIPDDSSTLDLLAIHTIFSSTQIEQSSLTERIISARRKKASVIHEAVALPGELGVERQEIEAIVERHIARHTQVTRKALDA